MTEASASANSSSGTSTGCSTTARSIRAVLFDFGGVVTTSPFEAFGRYEADADLPAGLIRRINSTNPDDNAWAKLERNEVDPDGFAQLFEAEAEALGYAVDGRMVLSLLSGDVRPAMVEAIGRIKAAGLSVACLTNNFRSDPTGGVGQANLMAKGDQSNRAKVEAVKAMFDHVIESSVIGIRKPEPEFYRRALQVVGVQATEAVFLDDLGINLKPARAMGLITIKVVDPAQALDELGRVLDLQLR